MTSPTPDHLSQISLTATPGLEAPLAEEMRALGFQAATIVPGGVLCAGGLAEAARANMEVRSAVRVLWRVAAFRAMHLAQLDKRAKKLAWRDWILPGTAVRVEATCRKSRIYHHKAAAQRVAGALEAAGFPVSAEAAVVVKVRIDDDLCTISLDTTGDALHKRGHKAFVGKAPLRETMAAGFLRQLDFDGSQAVVDPMCGSGTIVLEAAEIAAGLMPGRSRGFAFEHLLDAGAEVDGGRLRRGYLETRDAAGAAQVGGPVPRFFGSDRDQGAVQGATGNAERAGVAALCQFTRAARSDVMPPKGPPGIVLTNPPYGARIGNRKQLFGLYGALGAVLSDRFRGWRVGIVTSDGGLAKATGLDLEGLGPVAHGGLTVQLWQGRIGGA